MIVACGDGAVRIADVQPPGSGDCTRRSGPAAGEWRSATDSTPQRPLPRRGACSSLQSTRLPRPRSRRRFPSFTPSRATRSSCARTSSTCACAVMARARSARRAAPPGLPRSPRRDFTTLAVRPRGCAGDHRLLAHRERPGRPRARRRARAACSSRAARSASRERAVPRRTSRSARACTRSRRRASRRTQGASWCVAGTCSRRQSHPGEEGRGLAFVRALAAAVTIPDHRNRRRAPGALSRAARGRRAWGRNDPRDPGTRRIAERAASRLSFGV